MDEVRAGRSIMNALGLDARRYGLILGVCRRMERERTRWRASRASHGPAWPQVDACLEDRGALHERVGQLPLSVPTGPAGKSRPQWLRLPFSREWAHFDHLTMVALLYSTLAKPVPCLA